MELLCERDRPLEMLGIATVDGGLAALVNSHVEDSVLALATLGRDG
jgi:hypothetical protein